MKLFNIPPNQVKAVFIVSDKAEDSFLSFLFDLGQSWVERDFNSLSSKLEPHGVLLLNQNDSRLSNLFAKLYESFGITYYFVGSEHLLTNTNVDIFIHNTFVGREQWKEFLHCFKNQNGINFLDILKEIK